MPNYTAQGVVMLEELAKMLPNFAPAAHHAADIQVIADFGTYLLEYGEPVNGALLDLSSAIQFSSRRIHTSGEVKTGIPAFDGVSSKYVPAKIVKCHESIKKLLEDETLMNEQPMLKTYLNYADMILSRGASEHQDAKGYLFDHASYVGQWLFATFHKIPTAAEMAALQQNDPEAYATGMKIKDYLDACSEYYAADTLVPADQADKADLKTLEADKLRKMQKLEAAAQALSEESKDKINNFFRRIGCDEDQLVAMQGRLFHGEERKHFIPKVAPQLRKQEERLRDGLSIDEVRLLHHLDDYMKWLRSDLFGSGAPLDNNVEPFRTQILKIEELSRKGMEKFEHGFASADEKNAFFRELGDASEAFLNTLQTISPNDTNRYPRNTEEEVRKVVASNSLRETVVNEMMLKDGIFHRMIAVGKRAVGAEAAKKYTSRVEMGPAYTMLLDTKTAGLGNREGDKYRNFKEMMAALKTVNRQSQVTNPRPVLRSAIGENCRLAMEKGSEFLKTVMGDGVAPAADRKQLELDRKRALGVLGVMHTLDPKQAEQWRKKTTGLFGRELSWDDIRREAQENYNRKPNYHRYYELHTGENIRNLTNRKLVEYAAKATAALVVMDEHDRKFSLSSVRDHAKKLMESPDFKAAVMKAGPEKIREALRSGDASKIAAITAGTRKRYAISAENRARLRQLGESMQTDNRSKAWKDLKKALTNEDAASSRDIFSAIEAYTKGKKSVTNDPQRKESVKLALDALAIVAENGDEVAKARAKILTDRFNRVRGVAEGDPDYVDLRNRGNNQAEEPNQIIDAGIAPNI